MFRHPWILAAIIPALLALIWTMRKELVRVDTRYQDEQKSIKQRRRARVWMFISRALMISLVLVALATPVLQAEEFIDTDPRITVLKDTSESMDVLDTQAADDLIEQLRERVPVTVHEIASEQESPLGEDILAQVSESRNLLLVTDGQVTSGASLASVASFAASIDATLNAVQLPATRDEASVSIHGPKYVIEETDTTWEVRVDTAREQDVQLVVSVDDEVVHEATVEESTHQVTHAFSRGEHTIKAKITSEDTNAQNNAYTQTVTATSKPRVLYVTRKQSGLQELVTELYSADVQATIPQDLDDYYAVIINDAPLSTIRGSQQELTSYAAQGNGLLVAGGENSYDYGNYQNSVLETLLPVRVGTGTRERGGANIAIAIDMSGSTLGSVENVGGEWVQSSEQTQNVQKALAIDIIEQLNPNNRVGALGFTYPLPTQSQECSGACVVRRVEQLGNTKQELIDKIARLDITGGTALGIGMEAGLELLETSSGSKNIVFISDGVSGAQDQERALNAARTLAARGGQVYAVHVGTSETGAAFMQRLATEGDGVYFSADESNRLAVLFGEPVDIDQGDAFDLVALNQHHYITQGIDPSATLFGYNQVIPKTGSQVLLTSSGGDPVLTTWYYGVGRVASITGFNGPDYGQLLQEPNSIMVSRTINWLIGDPQRKQDAYARVPDARINQQARINVTAPSAPDVEGLEFERTEKDRYTATHTPQEIGVFELLNTQYAVNYPREHERLGTSPQLEEAVALTGGHLFENPSAQDVIAHAKELQRVKQSDDEPLRWPFIIAALLVFVAEVTVRRIREMRRRR